MTKRRPKPLYSIARSPFAPWIAEGESVGARLHGTPVVDQTAFRFRNDDGSETTATWKAALNTNVSLAPGDIFRIRIQLSETASVSADLTTLMEFRVNGGTWTGIGSSQAINGINSSNYATNDTTTEQLAGSRTFTAGRMVEGLSSHLAITVSNRDTEIERCCQIASSGLSNGDTIDLRFIDGLTGVYNVYSQIPQITVTGGGTTYPQTIAATGVGVATIPTRTFIAVKTFPATGVGVATMTRLSTFGKLLSVIGVGIPTITRLSTFYRTLAATGIGVATVQRIKTALVTLAATGVGVASLASSKLRLQLLSATGVGVVLLATTATFVRTLGVVGTGIATLATTSTFRWVAAVTGAGVVSLATMKTAYLALAVAGVGIATLGAVKLGGTVQQAVSAVGVGIASLTTRLTAARTLAVTGTGVPSMSRSVISVISLLVTATGIPTLVRMVPRLLSVVGIGNATMTKGMSVTMAVTGEGVPTMEEAFVDPEAIGVVGVGQVSLGVRYIPYEEPAPKPDDGDLGMGIKTN